MMCKIQEKELHELFNNIVGNSKYTKQYCNEHKGEYKVYSANISEELASIDAYDYVSENLSYSTRGNAGILTILKGKYSIGNNRAILSPKLDNMYLPYFKYILAALFKNVTRQNGIQATTWQLIKNIAVPIPMNDNNELDINYQIDIANKYAHLESMYKIILAHKKKLQNMYFMSEPINLQFTDLKINEIFDLSAKTNDSKFTKGFIKENSGIIPVYGASKNENDVGYGYVKDNLPDVKYFENCLTYNIDASAGYVFYRKNKFSLSEKVRPLIIKPEFKKYLDPLYLKYVIQPIFRANIRGRRGPNGQNEYTKINKTIIQDLQIPIPIKENGEFDLKAQKEISEKYKKLEAIKEKVINEIDKVLSITVEI